MSSVFAEHQRNTTPGPHFVGADALPLEAPRSSAIKPIAFYLPQFHAIPENDEWWGRGFTEWTNVTKALPRYVGHLQPRLPADLGFYDLSHVDMLRRQADLVRRSGIYGLCFHDYWFDGRKVLETPLNLLLANPDIDLHFCLNWANESWSRRWDGSEDNVLLEQRYDPDNLDGYARSILPAVRDPRYIRVNGRPVVLVYRPKLLPDAPSTFESWRRLFIGEGVGDPYLVMVQSFRDFDPRPYGLDAAASFPPHNSRHDEGNDRNRLRLLDREFDGRTHSYAWLIARMLAIQPSGYTLFPGVCPSWDNEARKPGRGLSFYGADPAAFEAWFETAARRSLAASDDPSFVFINAWNEWAEGAILEPDRHHGHANLLAVRRVVDRLSGEAVQESRATSYPPRTRPSLLNLVRNLPARAWKRATGKRAR